MQTKPGSEKSVSPALSAGADEGFRARQEREVTANYEAFHARFDEFYRQHPGEYALMRGGDIVEFFQGFNDAMKTGRLLYDDGVFSVQKVSQDKLDLGYWNHALLHAAR